MFKPTISVLMAAMLGIFTPVLAMAQNYGVSVIESRQLRGSSASAVAKMAVRTPSAIGYGDAVAAYPKPRTASVASTPISIFPPANLPPVITSVNGPKSLKVNEQGTWKVNAYDTDGNYLTYDVVWGDYTIKWQKEMQKMPRRLFQTGTFTHSYEARRNYNIIFRVTDQAGAFTEVWTNVFVSDITVKNRPPVITSLGGPTKMNVGETGRWKISAYDPEKQGLTYNIDWGDWRQGDMKAQEMTQDMVEKSQATTYTHSYDREGTYTIRFRVTDPQGLSAESTITVDVIEYPIPVPMPTPIIDEQVSDMEIFQD